MSTMDRDEMGHDDFDRLLADVSRMDDEALDAVVARATADYNAPPAGMRPPTEAMWTRIAATQRGAPRGMRGHLHVQRWQLLAASVAFVAFGITIGRQWSGVAGTGAHAAQSPRAAVTHTAVTPAPVAHAPSVTTPAQVADAGSATHVSPTHSIPRITAPSHAAPRVDDGTSGVATVSGSNAAYQLATMRHFAAAEALLASYDGSARDAKTDAQLASWASDLLSQTRLLLDSPAGRDPVRRRLLQDLELVLVQMAQLSPDASKSAALEHELIDGSVRHNDIITRLRSAVPAGATTAL